MGKNKKPPDKPYLTVTKKESLEKSLLNESKKDEHKRRLNSNGKPYPVYRTVTIPLKTILRNPQTNLPILQNYIFKVHKIVTLSYQFIRLYFLHLMEQNKDLPTLNRQLCSLVMNVVSNAKYKREPNDNELKKSLESFYEKSFKSVLPKNHVKPIFDNLSAVLQSVSVEMETSYLNNIALHFLPRLKRLLNKEINGKNLIPILKNESKTDWKKRQWQMKTAFWDGIYEKDKNKVPPVLHNLYDSCVKDYLPKDEYLKTLDYDIKANTHKYILPSMRLNRYFEKQGWKLFQPLSLRKNLIPCNIPINIKGLIYLMDFSSFTLNKQELIENTKKLNLEDDIWNEYLKMDHKIFKQEPYTFYHRIDTDGIKCSLTFVLKEYRNMTYKPKDPSPGDVSFQNLTELNDQELKKLQGKKLLGGDPGKRNMIQLVDGLGKKLRYTACQRDTESYSKKNRKIYSKLKTELGIKEKEKELNIFNSKTMSVNKFEKYLKKKCEINESIGEDYKKEVFRKLRLRKFIHGRRSIDKFVSQIEKTFGPNIVIGWGNWSRNGGMKGCLPSLGKGLRRKIEKKIPTVTVDEFNTSKKCHWCKKDLKNKQIDKKSIYRCLVCDGCQGREGTNGVHRHINRDINGSLNIHECLNEWIFNKRRPEGLKRACSSDRKNVAQSDPQIKNDVKVNLGKLISRRERIRQSTLN